MVGLSNYLVTEITDISSINRWIYYLYFSCIKTLATKHKISVRTVIQRYGYKDLSIPKPLPRDKTLATDLRITCKYQIENKPVQYTTLLNYKELMYTQSIPHRNRYFKLGFAKFICVLRTQRRPSTPKEKTDPKPTPSILTFCTKSTPAPNSN